MDSGTSGFNQIEIDTLNLIRATSERAWLAILHSRRTYGLHAGRVALWACWCVQQNDQVDSGECPYESDHELAFKGIPVASDEPGINQASPWDSMATFDLFSNEVNHAH